LTGGLLFYLGHERPDSVSPEIKILTSIVIVVINVMYFMFVIYKFVHEFWQDMKEHAKEHPCELENSKKNTNESNEVRNWSVQESTTTKSIKNKTKVQPISKELDYRYEI